MIISIRQLQLLISKASASDSLPSILKGRLPMLSPEDIKDIQDLVVIIERSIRLDNALILECEDELNSIKAPVFRWPLSGTTYLSFESYDSPDTKSIVYVDGEAKGLLTSSNEAVRLKQRKNMEGVSLIAVLLKKAFGS